MSSKSVSFGVCRSASHAVCYPTGGGLRRSVSARRAMRLSRRLWGLRLKRGSGRLFPQVPIAATLGFRIRALAPDLRSRPTRRQSPTLHLEPSSSFSLLEAAGLPCHQVRSASRPIRISARCFGVGALTTSMREMEGMSHGIGRPGLFWGWDGRIAGSSAERSDLTARLSTHSRIGAQRQVRDP